MFKWLRRHRAHESRREIHHADITDIERHTVFAAMTEAMTKIYNEWETSRDLRQTMQESRYILDAARGVLKEWNP